MKKLVSFMILLCTLANVALADCNWKTDITKLPDGGYRYTEGCHLMVGNLFQSSKTKDAQISDLMQALTLKDLTIQTSDKRAQLWMDTSAQLETRLQKIDSEYKHNEWLYFGLGVAATIGAGFMAAQLIKR